MPVPANCPRCHTRFDHPPLSGVCPECGSRLTPETEPLGSTHLTDVGRSVDSQAPTATAPNPVVQSTWTAGTVRPVSPVPPPPTIPGYSDLSPLGVGGMGSVYRAVQHGTERIVAVKFVHPAWAADNGMLKRFENEARALARVKHAGIVQVFEVGSDTGAPYFSMEFVPGGTLARLVREGPIAPRQAAAIMAAAASAVASAHAEGLLHRDIKPGNILLADDGTPKVTDFGLAKFSAASDGPTVTGAVLGTPSYMSPEQAGGRNHEICERTDVYGIGATLYELLTGRPPFKGTDYAATMQLVLNEEVAAPRSLRPDVPEELEAVCLQCLEKDKSKRYASAQAVADDLNAWLAGQPTKARPRTRWQKVKRWAGRNRVLVAVAAMVLLSAAAVYVTGPKRQIEWQLALGQPVTLVGEKGLPRYHRWELDETKLTLPGDGGGAPGFYAQQLSMLELASDTGSDTYRVTAQLRHLSGSEPNSRVGVYVGLTNGVAPTGERVVRFYGIELTEFPHPPGQTNGELRIADDVTVYYPDDTPCSESWLRPFFEFPQNNTDPKPFRELVIDVSPKGVKVSWRESDGSLKLVLPKTEDAAENARKELVKMFSPPIYPTPLPLPDWAPRGPVGIYAKNAGVAFRNVRITPSPSAPPH